ncbi:MAG: group 1 truncated hemoglobin, partial [Alphaproteobacteria bacterium]|nr:group 1 truncated hemoglobin [Alphaproteobacteria bacterium]
MSVIEDTARGGASAAESLFTRIGGEPAVNAAVELFYKKVVNDPLLRRFFDGVNLRRLQKKQKAFLTMAFGGPDRFNGRDLTSAHAKLVNIGLGDEHFNAVAGHLLATLNELGVAENITNEVMTIVASTREAVLGLPPIETNAQESNMEMNRDAASGSGGVGSSLGIEEYQQMLENMPINVMMADPQTMNITYINRTSTETLRTLEHLLPVKADAMLGQTIDIFHKDPAHQRRLLGDPRNLPHSALINVGDETLDLLVTAVKDGAGNYTAAMLTWSVVTQKIQKDAEAARLQQMVENMPINVLLAEPENLSITYMNKASRDTLKTLQQFLPVKVDDMIGQSIDIFHKDPSHQRRILADPSNLPHKANIKVGDEILDLLVTAIHDKEGNYVGPMLSWSVITQKLKADSESDRLQQMIDGMPINIMMVEPENLELTYMNELSKKTLRTLEHILPIKVDDMIGTSI